MPRYLVFRGTFQNILHYLVRPAAPREGSSEGIQCVYVCLSLCPSFGLRILIPVSGLYYSSGRLFLHPLATRGLHPEMMVVLSHRFLHLIPSSYLESSDPELSDVDLSAKPPSVATDSSRSRSDRGPRQNRHKAPSKGKSQDTGASSSGLTPVERARSLVLPTTELPATEVPREREWDSEKENDGSGETDTHPSTIDYHENLDLHVLQDGEYWPFLDETCKLASNTAYVFICG